MDNPDFLQNVQAFGGLTPEEFASVAALCAERKLQKGEELFAEGSAGNDFYVIREGVVAIFKKVAGGRKRNLINLDKGKIFGELALFDKEPRSAQAEAVEPSVVSVISIRQFEDLLQRNQVLAAKFQRNIILMLCSRLRDANEKLNQGVIWGFKAQG